MTDKETEVKVKQSAWAYTKSWGGAILLSHPFHSVNVTTDHHSAENPVGPTLLATLITAQSLRPPQFLQLLFPPVLLFSSYLNILDYKVDAAGISAAWSGLYMLLASRRKQPLMKKWGTRGVVRGATMGLCSFNLVAGGLVYAFERRKDEPTEGTEAS